MKNSAVHAAIANQFPDVQLDDITVTFIAASSTVHETEYEFAVTIINDEDGQLSNFIFKCSLTEA